MRTSVFHPPNTEFPAPAAVWTGPGKHVSNRFGPWELGIPRTDLSAAQMGELGPGFKLVWHASAAAELDARLPDPPLPSKPIEWATAWAHWGDTLACMSNARWMLDKLGQKRCSIIYTGPDAHVLEFLRAQPWIEKVVRGRGPETNRQKYIRAYSLAAYEDAAPVTWYPLIANENLPPMQQVTPTHPSLHCAVVYRCQPLKGAALPAARVQWAKDIWRERVRPMSRVRSTFMLHPFSNWSETLGNHWPHTQRAIEWLLENTPYTYVLTGMVPAGIKHPRLVDLVGETPSAMEVFALCDLCDGVISTCNSVAHWTVTQDLPGLILGNRVMDDIGYYFRRHVDRPPNTWINVDEPFETFERLASEFLRHCMDKTARQPARRTKRVAAAA